MWVSSRICRFKIPTVRYFPSHPCPSHAGIIRDKNQIPGRDSFFAPILLYRYVTPAGLGFSLRELSH